MRDFAPRKDPDPLKPGRNFDVDLQLRYLSPGAFTVLPPDEMPPPDPPQAPVPYRLTPTTRRNRNQAFSIIAEPSSRDASRSPSPTGRISPFRGRGFNPAGSRHASPAPSPPPGLAGGTSNPPRSPTKKSKIPQINRRNSSVLFGEKVTHTDPSIDSSPGGLGSQLSQSLTNISPSVVSNKPPPSPLKGIAKNPAFRQLSPILGSSPEPSQSQSSPSRIPTRSRSQPQSRLPSPTRPPTKLKPKLPSRTTRSTSRVQSRNNSREQSPSGNSAVPSKLTGKYQNVQPKVNSFSKPKVPPKPPLTSDSELSDRPSTKTFKYKKQNMNRVTNYVKKNEGQPPVKSKFNNKNSNCDVNSKNSNNSKGNEISEDILDVENIISGTAMGVEKISKMKKKDPILGDNLPKIENISSSITKTVDENSNLNETMSEFTPVKASNNSVKMSDIPYSSTATIVPITASAVTKPLKIDAIAETLQQELPKGISPMVDGRVLSATSVSQAINKMNDTVLDTKTLIRESGLSKLSPAASAIISMSRENNSSQSSYKGKLDEKDISGNKTLDIGNVNNPLNTSNTISEINNTSLRTNTGNHKFKNGNLNAKNVDENKNHDNETSGNHVTSTGLMDAKTLERHVQNNISKLIAAENSLDNFVEISDSGKIREPSTVFVPELKPLQPIHILVKEKPSDQDVESGNIRLPVSATNGSFHGRPSLPPDHPPQSYNTTIKEQQSSKKENENNSRTGKFLTSAKNHILCKTCRKNSTDESTNVPPKRLEDEAEKKRGCFSCLKKKDQFDQNIRIKVEEDGKEVKESCWNRLKCCRTKNKIGEHQGCLPFGKGKTSWKERRDSILSDIPNRPTCSNRCKNFMKKLLCFHLCKKKKTMEDLSISRRASMLSKKKSLTPTTQPVEDQTLKLDLSLVEHTSHMKAAIPVLPICLAWFCLIMNCLLPGTGTIMSGIFCLCIGKPRFSQKDSIRSRIGAFIIDCIVGASQTFTILFCLVGWGWSIWWGIIMVKLARKSKKIKLLAHAEEAGGKRSSIINQSTRFKDPERGS